MLVFPKSELHADRKMLHIEFQNCSIDPKFFFWQAEYLYIMGKIRTEQLGHFVESKIKNISFLQSISDSGSHLDGARALLTHYPRAVTDIPCKKCTRGKFQAQGGGVLQRFAKGCYFCTSLLSISK